MVSQQYLWVPESSNDVLAYSSNQLIEVLQKVLKPNSFEHNSFPSGRLYFGGHNPTYIDETLVYRTVMNKNLTDNGFWSFLKKYNAVNFDSIRFPGRGYIIRKSWSFDIPEWILYNRSTLRVSPNEMVSYVPDLAYSLNNNSNPNALYNVTEIGSVIPEMIHLIPDEIPDSIEVIRQGDLYWHRLHSIFDDMPLLDNAAPPTTPQAPPTTPQAPPILQAPQRTRTLLSIELPNSKSLMVNTTCNRIMTFLGVEYVIYGYVFPLITSSERLRLVNDRRKYLENLSEVELERQYTNYVNAAHLLYKNQYDLMGRIYFVENATILNLNENDTMVLEV